MASRTASHRKKPNIQADSTKLVKPSSRFARLSQSPDPNLCPSLGLCPKCLKPSDSLFKGAIRPSCAPERRATASLFFGRHLVMPCCSFWTVTGQQQQGCLREDLPPSALEGGACEAGGPGPHGGFLLLGMTTSVRHNWRL